MRLKSLMLLAIAMGLVLFLGTPTWADRHITGHERRQRIFIQRVAHGPKSGRINCRELVRLNWEQWRIQQFRIRALRDGHLGLRERHRFQRTQCKAGKHIRWAKNTMEFHNKCRVTSGRPDFREKPFRGGLR